MTAKLILVGMASIISLWGWYAIGHELWTATQDPQNSVSSLVCGASWLITQVVIILTAFRKELMQ